MVLIVLLVSIPRVRIKIMLPLYRELCNLADNEANSYMDRAKPSGDLLELKELMILSQSGDKGAYEQLLGKISLVLRSFIRARVKDPSAVEDVLQEILMGLHKARQTYDSSRPFAPWLYAITRYKISDFCKKARTREHPAMQDFSCETDSSNYGTEDLLLATIAKEEFENSIEKLSGQQKKVFSMMKLDGHSVKEVAKDLNMSESAVKVTAHRAYKVIRHNLVNES